MNPSNQSYQTSGIQSSYNPMMGAGVQGTSGPGTQTPYQTLPYQMPGTSGMGGIATPWQSGPPVGWDQFMASLASKVPPGSWTTSGGGPGMQSATFGPQNNLGFSQSGTSSVGGFNGVAANPINLGAQVGGGAPLTPAAPGVQTFQNGAYANWGQPTIQNQTAPSVLPPQQTFQNGAYGNWGQPTGQPQQNPLAPPPAPMQTFQNGAYGNWGGAPNPFANPLARPFTNGY